MTGRGHQDWWIRWLAWLASRRIKGLLGAVLALIPLGTVGYMLIERLSVLDALYMTVITLTTVGYGDITQTDAGRIFTIVLMVVGVGLFVVTLSAIAAAVIEGRLRQAIGRRRMEREIQELRGHVILAGYGRFGQKTSRELLAGRLDFVAIDLEPANVALAEERGIPALLGDATEEETLIKAGFPHAKGIITTLSTDAENVYVALTAKAMRPEVPVVTLARDDRAVEKLRKAGADYVVSPYSVGAVSMAQHILRPHLSAFVDQARTGGGLMAFKMEEIPVAEGSEIVGKPLKETPLRAKYKVTIVAIARRGGDIEYNPSPDHVIHAGDVLVGVGPPEGLELAAQRCASVGE